MRSISVLPVVFLALFARGSASRAADTLPASAPAPVSVKDFSTPIAAIKSFLQASYNQLDLAQPQDDAAVANTLAISPGDKDLVEAILKLTSSSAKLERACADAFGAAATAKQFGPTASNLLASRLKTVDSAAVTLAGDTATVQIPEDPATGQRQGSVIVRRNNGEWKIDAASMWNLTSKTPAAKKAQLDFTKKLIDIADQMTAEVRDHKYPSVKDAYIEFETRASKVAPAATAPATSPAPATAP